MDEVASNQYRQPYENKLLHDKVTVIFGAGGAIGSQIAREFSKEGATIFLSGRHLQTVGNVVRKIQATKERVYAAEVDPLNERAVKAYLDDVMKQAGKLDIVINAIGLQPDECGDGIATVELPYEKFMLQITTIIASQFITARAAARYMLTHHSGVIIFVNAIPARGVISQSAGTSVTFAAVEGMMRCLATEWSPSGIRVVCIRSAGMLDSSQIQQNLESMGRTIGLSKDEFADNLKQAFLLKRWPVLDDIGKMATFMRMQTP